MREPVRLAAARPQPPACPPDPKPGSPSTPWPWVRANAARPPSPAQAPDSSARTWGARGPRQTGGGQTPPPMPREGLATHWRAPGPPAAPAAPAPPSGTVRAACTAGTRLGLSPRLGHPSRDGESITAPQAGGGDARGPRIPHSPASSAPLRPQLPGSGARPRTTSRAPAALALENSLRGAFWRLHPTMRRPARPRAAPAVRSRSATRAGSWSQSACVACGVPRKAHGAPGEAVRVSKERPGRRAGPAPSRWVPLFPRAADRGDAGTSPGGLHGASQVGGFHITKRRLETDADQ